MRTWIVFGLSLSLVSEVWAEEGYPKVEPSGYLQVNGFYRDQGSDSDFGTVLNSIHVGFSGQVSEKVEFGIELDATTKVVLDEAKIELSYLKNHVITLGQFNVPFGAELPYSSTELLTINRAAFLDLFDEYRTGLAITGHQGKIEYELAAFLQPKDNPDGKNQEQDYVGRVQMNTSAGFVLGSSVYHDRTSDPTNSLDFYKNRFGVDARLDRSPVALWFEFMAGSDDIRPTDGRANSQQNYIGYYGMAAYTLRPAWQVVAKYDVYDPNTNQNNDAFRRYTAGVNWQIEERIRLMADLEYIDQEFAVDPEVMGIVQFQLVY